MHVAFQPAPPAALGARFRRLIARAGGCLPARAPARHRRPVAAPYRSPLPAGPCGGAGHLPPLPRSAS